MNKKTLYLILTNIFISVGLFFTLSYLFPFGNNENSNNRKSADNENVKIEIIDNFKKNVIHDFSRKKCINNSDFSKFLSKLQKLDNDLFEEFGRIDEMEGQLYEQLSELDKTKYREITSKEWLAAGKDEAAAQIKESLKELGKETLKEIEIHSVKAQDLMKQGKYEDAIRAAEEAISLAPDNALTGFNYLQIANCHSKAGNYEKAFDIADLIINKYPDSRIPDGQMVSANARYIMADICSKQGNINCVDKMKDELQERYSDAAFGNGKNILQVINQL